nr:protein kinase [Acidobacteriota bacterium]
KVLDFGLAKAQAGGGSAPDLWEDATLTAGPTHEGVVGTAPYMSPEQACGQALDKRTDIWAFGCVLYEMLTGHRAFKGDTVSDTLVTILEREPDWTLLPTATPSTVVRLLQRCLEKDPRRRLRDIGDARHWIEDVAVIHAGGIGVPSAPYSRRPLAWLLGAVALTAASFVGSLLWTRQAPAPTRSVQLQRLTDFVGTEESPALSPDGKAGCVCGASGQQASDLATVAGRRPTPADHPRRFRPRAAALDPRFELPHLLCAVGHPRGARHDPGNLRQRRRAAAGRRRARRRRHQP